MSNPITGREALIALSLRHAGDWDKIHADVRTRADLSDVDPEDLPENAVTILDPEYPESLKNSPKPPFVLWYDGDVSLLSSGRILSLAGSAHPSEYGEKVSEDIGMSAAAKKVVVCAKLSQGCQERALWGCALTDKAIAVLYRGIDRVDPDGGLSNVRRRILELGGLIVSEYPGKTEPTPRSAVESTRIVAALGKVLAIPEAAERSGSLIAAGMALNLGRDVACVPHRITDGGACNGLIAEGAYCLHDVRAFFDEFFPKGA